MSKNFTSAAIQIMLRAYVAIRLRMAKPGSPSNYPKSANHS